MPSELPEPSGRESPRRGGTGLRRRDRLWGSCRETMLPSQPGVPCCIVLHGMTVVATTLSAR
jgi:hypothetical protein